MAVFFEFLPELPPASVIDSFLVELATDRLGESPEFFDVVGIVVLGPSRLTFGPGYRLDFVPAISAGDEASSAGLT